MKALALFAAAAFTLVGCSKDEPPLEPSADLTSEDMTDMQAAAPDQAAPAPPPMPAVQGDAIQQDLNSIPLTLENQDYVTAVDQLGAMGQVQSQMSESQRQAYQQQLFNAQQYLIEQAKNDAAAQQALDRLGRQVMGR